MGTSLDRRRAGVVLVHVVLLLAIGGLLALALPPLVEQVGGFVNDGPRLLGSFGLGIAKRRRESLRSGARPTRRPASCRGWGCACTSAAASSSGTGGWIRAASDGERRETTVTFWLPLAGPPGAGEDDHG